LCCANMKTKKITRKITNKERAIVICSMVYRYVKFWLKVSIGLSIILAILFSVKWFIDNILGDIWIGFFMDTLSGLLGCAILFGVLYGISMAVYEAYLEELEMRCFWMNVQDKENATSGKEKK
jgi:hypothetical protein